MERCDIDRVRFTAVTNFDEFMALEGCTTGTHSSEKEEAKIVEKEIVLPTYFDENGKESYGTPPPLPSSVPSLPPLPPAPIDTIAPGQSGTPTTKGGEIGIPKLSSREIAHARIEEQDDPIGKVDKGMRCKRRGCEVDYDGETRQGEECYFHPGAASSPSLSLM